MTCLPTWRCGVDVRLTLRLKEGERLEWEAAAGADVPLSRFVKRVVNEHVRGLPRAGVVKPDFAKVTPEVRPAVDASAVTGEAPKPKSAAELARAAAALAEGKGKEVTPDWRKK